MIRLILVVLLLPVFTFAQSDKIHIGSDVDKPSAILQVDSDSKGILVPRMNSMQRNSLLSPVNGLLVYDTDQNGFLYYDDSAWIELINPNSNGYSFITNDDEDVSVYLDEGGLDNDVIDFKVLGNASRMKINDDRVQLLEGIRLDVGSLVPGTNNFQYYPFDNNTLRFGNNLGGIKGANSVSFGVGYFPSGANTLVIGSGNSSVISGTSCTIFGLLNDASGSNGLTMGSNSETDGLYATAWGNNCSAVANGALAWGSNTEATAANATAWGLSSQANQIISTAFGNSIAGGSGSLSFGGGEAVGNYSFCSGNNTKAYSTNEIVMGHDTPVYTPAGNDTDRLFAVGTSGIQDYNAFQILKDNSAWFRGELRIISEFPGQVRLGLKEETNGLLYGFEFEYDALPDDLHLSSKNFAGNDAIRMTWDASGKVGIGKDPTTNRLEVNGAASKNFAGPWASNSDSRLKKNIQNMDSQAILNKVLQMQGVTYEWNDDKTGYERPEGIQYGFIAQDLEEIWPEKVSEDNLGFLQTAYGDYDPIFVGAFRSQQKEIEKLQKENNLIIASESKHEAEYKALAIELEKMEKFILAAEAKMERE